MSYRGLHDRVSIWPHAPHSQYSTTTPLLSAGKELLRRAARSPHIRQASAGCVLRSLSSSATRVSSSSIRSGAAPISFHRGQFPKAARMSFRRPENGKST